METQKYNITEQENSETQGYTNATATDDNNQPVYLERSSITIQPQTLENNERPVSYQRSSITMQPQTLESGQSGGRLPIPVSTVDWRSTNRSQFIAMRGLDFLIGVTTLIVQQTVELGDLMANIESENRYTIKVPAGEMLFMGYEVSDSFQRACCGSARGFSLSLIDTTRQEALFLHRRLAASSFCFPCRLQEIQVTAPTGQYLGKVQQQWTMSIPFFLIKDSTDEVLYLLEGPNMPLCGVPNEAEFKILSADAMTEQGTIVHKWDFQLINYTMTVNFPLMATDLKQKALILGAAFLLEYTYFERAKTKSILRCNCF